MIILGLSGALTHDPSAALYIDGKLVAAAEEERFVRDKHAKNRMPYESAKFCLDFAGIKPSQVDAVAIPFAPISLSGKARWHYAKRYWYAPDRGLDGRWRGERRSSPATSGARATWWGRRRRARGRGASPHGPARASPRSPVVPPHGPYGRLLRGFNDLWTAGTCTPS